MKRGHFQASDLHGLSQLAVGATTGLTDLVEEMHGTIAAGPGPVGARSPGRTRGITRLVYRSIRSVTRLVGFSLDAVLSRLPPSPAAAGPPSPEREAALAILNGVCGDHLETSGNNLAISMRFRDAGQPLELDAAALAAALPAATGKVLLLVHGLCRNDLQWSPPPEETEGPEGQIAALARELGYTQVALHYNTGRPIGANGRQLSELLASLAAAWPVELEELSIVAHSMGGLVARSACHYAAEAGLAWPRSLRRLVFLGTPHSGAPLERGGHWLEELLGRSPYTAPFVRLARIRSAGITDLRHGRLLDDGQSPNGEPPATRLPPETRAYAIAASLAPAEDETTLRGELLGDGLVPVASALGLELPPERQFVVYATGHLRLVTSPAACEKIRGWLAEAL